MPLERWCCAKYVGEYFPRRRRACLACAAVSIDDKYNRACSAPAVVPLRAGPRCLPLQRRSPGTVTGTLGVAGVLSADTPHALAFLSGPGSTLTALLQPTSTLQHHTLDQNPLHRTTYHARRYTQTMALKRINKELTDLGRYVAPLLLWRRRLPFARMTACECGALHHERRRRSLATTQSLGYLANPLPTVTLLRPAQLAPSAMIWYVTLCARFRGWGGFADMAAVRTS